MRANYEEFRKIERERDEQKAENEAIAEVVREGLQSLDEQFTGALDEQIARLKQMSARRSDIERLTDEREAFKKENRRLQAAMPQPDDEGLKQRCCKLSAEMFDFYKRQRENLDNALESGYGTHLLKEPERSRWRSEETERHEKGMVDKYCEQFGGAASALCDDLEPRGWCTAEERSRFENPTGPQDIRYTAQQLNAICRRSGYEPKESPAQQNQPQSAEDLRQRSCKLSAELSELIGRWRNAVEGTLQPGMMASVRREADGDPDGSLEIKSHDNWLMEEYDEQFSDKVLRLSDELAWHRCITPETRKKLESPESPKDVRYIARRLKVICDDSEEG